MTSPRAALLLELIAITIFAAVAAAAMPWATGYFAWSWDALNHHIYLGMTAEQPRWQLDVVAASFQSYQYPYLYWPVYRLSLMQGSGATIGAAWAAIQAALLAMPVWFISLRLLTNTGSSRATAAIERLAACAMAFMSLVVIMGLETTANDVLAAVPLLWSIAIGLQAKASSRRAFAAAFTFGVAVAFKLSNGLFLLLLLFWWWQPGRPHLPLLRGMALAIGASAGFAVPYSPWGWQLWRLTGNPFYPYFSALFGGA